MKKSFVLLLIIALALLLLSCSKPDIETEVTRGSTISFDHFFVDDEGRGLTLPTCSENQPLTVFMKYTLLGIEKNGSGQGFFSYEEANEIKPGNYVIDHFELLDINDETILMMPRAYKGVKLKLRIVKDQQALLNVPVTCVNN